jgi:hypothetical protein
MRFAGLGTGIKAQAKTDLRNLLSWPIRCSKASMRTFHEQQPCLLIPGDNLEDLEEADAAKKLALEVTDELEQTEELPSWLEASVVLGGFDDFADFLDHARLLAA